MSQENIELVRAVYEAVDRRDLDTANSYLQPEIQFHTYRASGSRWRNSSTRAIGSFAERHSYSTKDQALEAAGLEE